MEKKFTNLCLIHIFITQHVDLDNNENRGFGFTIVFIGDAMTYRPWFR